MRVAAIAWCLQIPGLQVYLFRRTYPDLIANHMSGPSSFPMMLAEFIVRKKCEIVADEVRFSNGSKIKLCHCQHEKDVTKYQGAEIHVLLIDELTHFTETIYRFLRGRLRLGTLKVPDAFKGMFPRILCGSNPGSLGHAWVKRTFIDEQTPYDIRITAKDDGGLQRQYIPALLEDNPTLTENDPDYESRLEGLGSPDLVKAMRYGLWDITAGAAFEKLSRDKHMLRSFRVPDHWTKFTVIDWGTAKPFAVGWFCVCDDDLTLTARGEWKERHVPKGALIMYRELYGWNGKPNEGCRMESFEVVRKVLEIEESHGEMMDYRIGDAAMWAEHDGPSVAEKMYDSTDGRYNMIKSKKDRIVNYQEVRARLVGDDNVPMLYATENCRHFWRTMPDLQLDELHPEKGPDTDQEDHCFIAGTPIITANGVRNIEDICSGDLVLTTEGFLPCISLGKTTEALVYEVEFDDAKYMATGNHPFLTNKGLYIRLDSLRQGDKVACIESFLPQNKNSTAPSTTYATSIFKGKALASIALFGSIITGIFQRVITFITKIITAPIMMLPIWNYCINQNISAITSANQNVWRVNACILSGSGRLPRNGINHQRGEHGTAGLPLSRALSVTNVYVKSARSHFSPQREFLNTVATNAPLKHSEKEILAISAVGAKPVFNLSVPGPNNFVLGNGVIVHNCYDVISYACASRPTITTKAERKEVEYKKQRRKLTGGHKGY